MATESVIRADDLEEIYRELLNISALAKLLQKATGDNCEETDGIYGAASIIETCAERAIKLTGV